ncbi:glycosyltransferase, partial [Robertkochia marina]
MCLDSVLNQNIPLEDYEILVVDDGSEDQSVNLVRDYAVSYSNIKLYSSQNKGVYAQRNFLMREARGNYLYHLDADDYIVKDCLAQLLNTAEGDNLEIISFGSQIIKERRNQDTIFPELLEKLEVSTGKKMLAQENNIRYEAWWFLVKTSFLKEEGIWFAADNYLADVNFTYQLFWKAKRVSFLNLNVHYYYQTENSLMRDDNDNSVNNRLNGYI